MKKVKSGFCWKLAVFVCLIAGSAVNAYADTDYLDVETLPSLRTKRYSAGPYSKIIVYSAPRTGSSLVYNVLRFLFENEKGLLHAHDEFHPDCSILRTHKYPELASVTDPQALYLIPIRDPLQSGISSYRICFRTIKSPKDWCRKIIQRQVDHMNHVDEMIQAGKNIKYVKYEDSLQDISTLLSYVENFFEISISETDKKTIHTGLCKKNIYANIEKIGTFQNFLPISGFHGKHVELGEFVPSPEIVSWLTYYVHQVKGMYQPFGYFPEGVASQSPM